MRRALIALVMLSTACSGQSGTPVGSTSARPSPAASGSQGTLSNGGIVEYSLPPAQKTPSRCLEPCPARVGSVANGPDGDVWFVDGPRWAVGRVMPSGQIKEFALDVQPVGGAQTITAGPDGNMWLTAFGATGKPDWILRVSPDGSVARFPSGSDPGNGPESIAAGPDGNIWFTEVFGDHIGRMTPSGRLTEFPIPGASAPRGITPGRDGNMWFTFSSGVGSITMQGQVHVFQVGNDPAVPLGNIVFGPDGKLWFTGSNKLRRIAPDGSGLVAMPLPDRSSPFDLVTGPDGNVWFSDGDGNAIVRIGVTGALRAFPLPRRYSYPSGLAVGGDGRIWFAETYPTIASIGVKVPELLMDRRPLVFADTTTRRVSLRNTGDAPLLISGARIAGVDSGLFTKVADSCAGSALPPGASCTIELGHAAGGPAGLQSALLEITDNGTGSPQLLSLLAQVPQCTLPVVTGATDTTPGQGLLLDVPTARFLYDAGGVFVDTSPGDPIPGVQTAMQPVLSGRQSGYFDRANGRWLPVADASSVSPDGERYAYIVAEGSASQLHVVDIGSGLDVAHEVQGSWGIVAFGADGLFVHPTYEVIGAGLWLIDPATGAIKTVLTGDLVEAVTGSTAWIAARNTADKLPQPPGLGGSHNEIEQRDLATGKTVTWLYRPGMSLGVSAVLDGGVVVGQYDGTLSTYWLVTALNQAVRFEAPFTSEMTPDFRFAADAPGIWVGSPDGVYLWTARTGAVLMTDSAGSPAGTCG